MDPSIVADTMFLLEIPSKPTLSAIVAALPKDRVQLADNLAAVEEYVNIGRRGRELYAYAIGLVALLWGAEHVLANRFYRDSANSAK